MSKAWTFAAGVAGVLGVGACALVTHFDGPAVADGGGGCVGSSALLCEDFENGACNAPWTSCPQMGGTWDLDSTHVHSGKYALHLHSELSDADGQEIVVAWQDAMKGGGWPFPVYLRAYLYWTEPLATEVANFFQLQNQARSTGFVLYAGTGQLGWTNWPSGPTRGLGSGPPTAQWTCVEWQFDGPSGSDVQVLYIDGGASQSLADPDASTFPFYELDIGMQIDNDEKEPAMDLWMDDVVLDTSPIPCGD
jgi:hypothetical protein